MAFELPFVGYSDTLLHVKEKNEEGEDMKRIVFPITRYKDGLNHPRCIDSVVDSPNAVFHFLKTEEIEVNDDDLFEMIGQIW